MQKITSCRCTHYSGQLLSVNQMILLFNCVFQQSSSTGFENLKIFFWIPHMKNSPKISIEALTVFAVTTNKYFIWCNVDGLSRISDVFGRPCVLVQPFIFSYNVACCVPMYLKFKWFQSKRNFRFRFSLHSLVFIYQLFL